MQFGFKSRRPDKMKRVRKILKNFWFIHFLVFLGFFALLGYLLSNENYLIFFVTLSFAGAICGSFIRVIDALLTSK